MHSKDEPSLADLWRETHGSSGAIQVFMAKLADLGSGGGDASASDAKEQQVRACRAQDVCSIECCRVLPTAAPKWSEIDHHCARCAFAKQSTAVAKAGAGYWRHVQICVAEPSFV